MREFSELTSSISLSPNHSGTRTKPISRITPHCIVGQATEKRCQELFSSPSRQASANYCISCDGKVVGIVPETYRSWCSGGDLTAGGWTGSQNDQAAITIECASDSIDPYAFTSDCYTTLIHLCVDICKAYGKTKVLWIEDKEKANKYVPKDDEMIFTVHRWYARKSCPGDWLYKRMGELAASVNRLLGADPQPTPQPQPQPTDIESYLWNTFKYLGDFGCAGLLANLRCESAYNPKNLQNSFEKKFGMDDDTYTVAVDNGAWDFVHDSAGYGLAQWTYWSRKDGLYKYIKSKNKSIGDLESQIEYCKSELQSYSLVDKLKNCKSVKEASDLVMTVYEKPADQSEAALKRRSDIAEEIYAKYSKSPQPITEELYRVRKSWEDVSSQIGAYKVYDNAVKVCNENPGYSVFDSKGKCLYTSKTSELYRVRLSWEDAKSQVGAYSVYDNAVHECDKHPGYSVYDSNGACLYTSKKSNEEVAKEVIQGKCGNGEERKQRLTEAGYDYHEVQALVNKMLR